MNASSLRHVLNVALSFLYVILLLGSFSGSIFLFVGVPSVGVPSLIVFVSMCLGTFFFLRHKFKKDDERFEAWNQAFSSDTYTLQHIGDSRALRSIQRTTQDITLRAEHQSEPSLKPPEPDAGPHINSIHATFASLTIDIHIHSKHLPQELDRLHPLHETIQTGDQAFDEAYLVTSPHTAHANAFLTPALRTALVQYADLPGVINLTHNHLSYFDSKGILDHDIALRVFEQHTQTIEAARKAAQNAADVHLQQKHRAHHQIN